MIHNTLVKRFFAPVKAGKAFRSTPLALASDATLLGQQEALMHPLRSLWFPAMM